MVEMVEAKEQVEVAYAREEKCMSFDISCRTVKLAVRVELGKNYNTQNYLDDSQLGYFWTINFVLSHSDSIRFSLGVSV